MNPRFASFLLHVLGFTFLLGTVFSPGHGKEIVEPFPLPQIAKSSLTLWLAADKSVQTNASGFVFAWNDQSPNGNHAIQTNSVAMPELVSGSKGQAPFLKFNGTNFLEIADSSSTAVTNDFSLFVVLRAKNFSSFYGVAGKGSGKRNRPSIFDFYIYQSTGRPLCFRGFGSNFAQGRMGVELDEWTIVSFVAHGTNMVTSLNGFPNGHGAIATDLEDREQPIYIGSRANGGMKLEGDIAEIILLRSATTTNEQRAIHTYLGEKYGIEMALDIRQHGAVQRFEGQTATFSASVLSASPLRYQWQRNGVDIPNATDPTYTTAPLASADNNSVYRVRISSPETNRYGSPVTLSVVPDTEPLTATTAAFLLREQSPSALDTNENYSLPPYNSRLWQPGEDSPRNTVQAIAQTSDGFLWIGTHGGVARFNGKEFEFIPLSVSSNAESKRINALCIGENGSLWAGGNDGLFQLKNGQWIRHPFPAGSDETILSLRGDQNGVMWIGTRSGLALCKNERLSLFDGSGAANLLRAMATQPIRSIFPDRNGQMWFSAGIEGIVLRNEQAFTNYNFTGFKPGFIRSICTVRDGSIWAGSNSGLIHLKDGKATSYSKMNGLPDNTVTSVHEDRRGNLWIGTYGGLCRFVDGKFVTELTSEGESYDQILCFFEDREDNLWVGAKNGLYQLAVQQFITYTTRHGLAHNNVISVYEDDEGAIWIGTWGGGLHCLRGGKISIYTTAKSKTMRNDLILALHGAYEGGVWFAEDYDGGLYRLHNGQFDFYGRTEGLGRGAVRTLLEDDESRLWIGLASSYLSVLEGDRIVSFGAEHGLPTNSNRCLLQTQDGRIWAGTEAGLCLWTNGGFTTITTRDGLAHNAILSLYEDKERNLWVGTAKGLCRMENGKGKREKLETDGVPHVSRFTFFEDAILEILEDDFENLWLATRHGVLRVMKTELEKSLTTSAYKVPFTLFGKADGMASQVCVGVAKPSAFKSNDGRLWFATTKGLAVTDPKLQIAENEKPPPVVIREVWVDKKKIENGEWKMENGKPGASITPSSLFVRPGRGELEFHYTALSYTAPEKNRFKYKLEGLDSDWIDAGTRREAYYNNVPPGDYTFQVIACNNDGVWNSVDSSVKLSLQPHFWQTWWFKGFLAAAGGFLVAGSVRFATRRRMQRRLELLEQQHAIEKERSRIAQDMHDELGARLTEIVLLSDRAQKSTGGNHVQSNATISEVAREIGRDLNAIIWAVNPANDSLEKTVSYICNFVGRFLTSGSMTLRQEVPDELPSIPLSADVRHGIFLVAKEAVNNAVKYSRATELCLCIRFEEGILSVVVADNGTGFDTVRARKSGNGLGNMEDRITRLGGVFALESAPGKGTRVEWKVPLQR